MYYQNFDELCKQINIKPNKVSKETGVSTATLTSWKHGKYTPNVQWDPSDQTIDYTISLSEEEQDLLIEYRKAESI